MDGSAPILIDPSRFTAASVRTVLAADLFCGGGGTSTGLKQAIARKGMNLQLVAVNHWSVAVDTHSTNHPDAVHYCQDLATLRPLVAVPGGRLDLMVASPTCTYHSRARGGRPTSDQQRQDPWHLLTWLTELRVARILVENVPEFVKWGPVDPATGRPIKEREGEYFRAWVRALEAIGFVVEWRIVTCAEYGDGTTRQRFLLIGRSDGLPLRWAAKTHGRPGTPGLRPWRTARDIIDWRRKGRDVFGRPVPLKPNTLRRIMVGVERHFGGLAPAYLAALDLELARSIARWGDKTKEKAGRKRRQPGSVTTPALIELRGTACAHPVDNPVPGITGGGYHLGVVSPEAEPFTMGQHSGSVARRTSHPLMTVAGKGAISLVQPSLNAVDPILLHVNHQGEAARLLPVNDPLPTGTSKRGIGVATALIAPYYGSGSGETCKPATEPLDSPTTKARFGLVEPILVQIDQHGSSGPCVRPTSQPTPTLITKQNLAVAEPVLEPAAPFISVYNGPKGDQVRASRPATAPLPSPTTEPRFAVCEPWLEATIAGSEELQHLAEQRRLTVIDGVLHVIKLPFRMLFNDELARAMSFPEGYEFRGKQVEVTKQIGNAVPVYTAEAHIAALFED
ncbi:DNA cytosine methyltransferase [Azospirillum sp. Sh1]|uniref:DNA cytosine methyltransferase n=1 Tax=Azospirillum sp. Sh1 TaxID=2607285 RepID=UPI0011EE18DB|nr:DNA cytosine methyltransferase [Azospirillum sp. Sh1]KAA0571108.1 DNA cytosine methyltransferase [Azospirillum sp. Sh1]